MFSEREHYIHELDPKQIVNILQNSAWKTADQKLTSADTNDNNLTDPNESWLELGENTAGINAFYDINFDKHVTRVLDVGGGKYNNNSNYMLREKNITLLVWDPYNRTHDHNEKIRKQIINKKVDAVTSMSVLNVISEPEARLAHIVTLKAALNLGGKAYFKIWPGDIPLRGSYLPSSSHTAYQANAFANRFLREIELVFGERNVMLNKSVANLIVAEKTDAALINMKTILHIQNKSKKESQWFQKIRDRSVRNLYGKVNISKLFAGNFNFFKNLENEFITQNRHNDTQIQHEYDKRFGIILA
jgi:hypothetical protein